jgi:UDP-N-acetylglucosamine/UDP-N-acetylgalactosamine diphosphorylase
MIVERDAKYLEAAGVKIPRKADGSVDALIELAPINVIDADDARQYVEKTGLKVVTPGAKVCLD